MRCRCHPKLVGEETMRLVVARTLETHLVQSLFFGALKPLQFLKFSMLQPNTFKFMMDFTQCQQSLARYVGPWKLGGTDQGRSTRRVGRQNLQPFPNDLVLWPRALPRTKVPKQVMQLMVAGSDGMSSLPTWFRMCKDEAKYQIGV